MRLDYTPEVDDSGFVDPDIDITKLEFPAWYSVQFFHEVTKKTKRGDGMYLRIGYKVKGGPASGLTVFGNFNTQNPNAMAQKIGRKQLGELMYACGLVKGADSREFVGKYCDVRFQMKQDPGYGPELEAVAWRPYGEKSPFSQAAMADAALAGTPAPDAQPPSDEPPPAEPPPEWAPSNPAPASRPDFDDDIPF